MCMADVTFVNYVVQHKESLSEILHTMGYKKIYGKNGILNKVIALNNLNDRANVIHPGQTIKIPDVEMIAPVERSVASLPSIVVENNISQEKISGTLFVKSMQFTSHGSDLGGYTANIETEKYYGLKLDSTFNSYNAFISISSLKFSTTDSSVTVAGQNHTNLEFGLVNNYLVNPQMFIKYGVESRRIFYTNAITYNNFTIKTENAIQPMLGVNYKLINFSLLPIMTFNSGIPTKFSGNEVRLSSEYGQKRIIQFGTSYSTYEIENNKNSTLVFDISIKTDF